MIKTEQIYNFKLVIGEKYDSNNENILFLHPDLFVSKYELNEVSKDTFKFMKKLKS